MYADWAKTEGDAEHALASMNIHCGPVYAVERSPFFEGKGGHDLRHID